MSTELSRRAFLSRLGLAALTLPALSWAGEAAAKGVPGLKLGYSAITWGGNDVQAIKDIADLGFKGIQLRANVLKEYGSKPEALRALLQQHKLQLVMFSGGNANINTGKDEEVIQNLVETARFVKALGGKDIQVTNSSRPKTGAPSTPDLQAYGRLLDQVGKRTGEFGVQVSYHNHMHQLGETPQEVEVILAHCDPRHVKLELDVAHYHQGGGNPVEAVTKYRDRLHALHLKDVRPKTGSNDARAYTFVELGQGQVDLPGVFKALEQIKFKGWGIIELDSVPDKSRTPRQCAEISKAYLQKQGMKVST
ncbi:MAG: sugar phosphate isomerase/epimerase family protein [Adhaeribacter sp.]